MNVFVRILMCLVLFISISSMLFAQKHENEVFDKDIVSLIKEYKINASSIIFVKNGEVILSNGYGKEGVFSKNIVSVNSVFEAGSIGKTITAYVVLQLVNNGKLNLEDKIITFLDKKYITNDERFSEITVSNLLSHTAGFSPSFEFGIDKNIYFNPETEFSYSGVGYIFLQNIIENITGKSFEEVVVEYVFDPLNMENSTFLYTKTVTPFINTLSLVVYTLAIFFIAWIMVLFIIFIVGKKTKFKYFNKKHAFYLSIIIANTFNIAFILIFMSKILIPFLVFIVIGFGILFLMRKTKKLFYLIFPLYTVFIIILCLSLFSSLPVTNDIIKREANCAYSFKTTSYDMSLFLNELLDCYNNDCNNIRKMFAPIVTIDENNSWGLGIGIERIGNNITYWHSGINPGFQSLFVIIPEQNSYVIILTNSDRGLEFSKKITKELINLDGTWNIKRTVLRK
jgi:CubicO group peptidase (beta-lactamase class C family)